MVGTFSSSVIVEADINTNLAIGMNGLFNNASKRLQKISNIWDIQLSSLVAYHGMRSEILTKIINSNECKQWDFLLETFHK